MKMEISKWPPVQTIITTKTTQSQDNQPATTTVMFHSSFPILSPSPSHTIHYQKQSLFWSAENRISSLERNSETVRSIDYQSWLKNEWKTTAVVASVFKGMKTSKTVFEKKQKKQQHPQQWSSNFATKSLNSNFFFPFPPASQVGTLWENDEIMTDSQHSTANFHSLTSFTFCSSVFSVQQRTNFCLTNWECAWKDEDNFFCFICCARWGTPASEGCSRRRRRLTTFHISQAKTLLYFLNKV